MYRILIASNGYYYVQRYNGQWWKKVGGFFRSRQWARAFIREIKGLPPRPIARVVEYV